MENDREELWLYESIQRYDRLHMFDLQHPALAMCYMDDHLLGLASYNDRTNTSECQLLILPNVLAKGVEESVMDGKNRDCKLVAGQLLSGSKLVYLERFGQGRLLAYDDIKDKLIVLPVQNENQSEVDSINCVPNSCCENQSRSCVLHQGFVAHGRCLNSVCLYDLEKNAVVSRVEGECQKKENASLANILSSGPNICITMTQTNGQLFLCDQRVSNDWKSISSHNSSQGELWTFDHKDNDVIKLSANGSLMKYDVRNNKEILLQKLNKTPEDYANVKISPMADEIAVKVGPHIDIYTVNDNEAKHMFRHDGHFATAEEQSDVTSYQWHPAVPQLITSASNTGSLQAWKYCL